AAGSAPLNCAVDACRFQFSSEIVPGPGSPRHAPVEKLVQRSGVHDCMDAKCQAAIPGSSRRCSSADVEQSAIDLPGSSSAPLRPPDGGDHRLISLAGAGGRSPSAKGAAIDCLHAISIARAPGPHAFPPSVCLLLY